MSDSLSAIVAKLPAGSYTLLADLVAFRDIERAYDCPWFEVMDRISQSVRLDQVAVVFAACARSGGHKDMTEDKALEVFGGLEGYAQAIVYVRQALDAAFPPPKAKGDAIDEEGTASPPV